MLFGFMRLPYLAGGRRGLKNSVVSLCTYVPTILVFLLDQMCPPISKVPGFSLNALVEPELPDVTTNAREQKHESKQAAYRYSS
jgi:hypothetical protein